MITAGTPPLVHLEGAPRLRGHTHGEALRPLIARGVQCWTEAIHDSTGLDPDAYLDRFVAATDFRPAIARWAPTCSTRCAAAARAPTFLSAISMLTS